MKIIFFGSGDFAVRSLESLHEAGHKIALVITQPDKPKGRHLLCCPTEVKIKAQELKLDVYQPSSPNSPEAQDVFSSIQAELFVVISYGHILKSNILKLPKLYPLNVHASLLPKYRGAAPINWAIINGESETGITIIKMDETMDGGDILLKERLTIAPHDTAQSLREKLACLSAASVIEAISLIEHAQVNFTKQDQGNITFAPKLKKSDGLINWNREAPDILNQIRGLVPWPAAFTYYKGKLLKIWDAKKAKEDSAIKPATILKTAKGGLVVATGLGSIEILELQLAGEKRMSAEAFLCGHKLTAGNRLG